MNPLDRIAEYLSKLESRLRWLTLSRGTALLGGVALLITVALVLLLNRVAFSAPALFGARFVLFLSVAAALVAGLVMPLVALNRRRSARAAESKFPAFGDRLLTFTERQRSHPHDPFLPLLAEDAMQVADQTALHEVASPTHAVGFASIAAASGAVLLWLALAGPGFLGYGTSLLWGGNPRAERKPFRAITVEPGTATLRRRMDQPVFAKLHGFDDPNALVFARYASSAKWEQAPMHHQPNGPAFEFVFAALPENVEYYVESAGVRSDVYKLSVSDLPEIKKLTVTYHFPSYYGMRDVTEDPGGDLRAVEGTVAEVQVTAAQALTGGNLVLDSGESFPMNGSLTARVPIQKDGMYHVAALDHGTPVRLSEDFFIEARKDSPPTVSITRPGRDAKVSPVEEVPVHIQARDDYGLQAVELHYSVNGGAEQTRSVLNGRGAKTSDGSVLLSMEEFKAVPGDIVSLYATARDARTTAHTDILFIQAKPFEFNYSQSQQEGQPGAAGDPSQKISERQQEVIAATFNQLRDTSKGKAAAQDNAKYLADVQSKLREQAKSLADRMKSRDLGSTNPATQSFVQNVELAVQQMVPAADQLRAAQWQPALSPEQKALQYLLRAEANFRDIQIAMSKSNGSSGQAGGSRDMENLSELELDTNKNNYESGRQSGEDDQQKKVDDALARLKELAKRQQQLAEQQQRNQPNFQQRWEQEMLRREAEQLRREMQQMAQNQQGQSQTPSQQSNSQQQGQGGTAPQQPNGQGQQQQSQQRQMQEGGGQGQQQRQQGGQRQPQDPQIARNNSSGSQQTLQQALDRLNEATRNMSDAASSTNRQSGNNAQTQADARRAAERLQEAGDMLSQMRRKQTGSAVDDLAQQASGLARNEEDFMNRLRQKFGGESGSERSEEENRRLSEQMANEKQRLREQMQRLEHGMQQTARDMASTQPGASSKMRDAISTLQQDEVESRMKRAEDMIRRGRAPYAVMSEATVLRALNEVKDKLEQAQSAMGRDPNQNQGLEQALAQAQKLRQSLERATASRGKSSGEGKQPGGNQSGQQQARNSSPQRGQGQGGQPGQSGQPGKQGQPGEQGQEGGGEQPGQSSSASGNGTGQQGQQGLGQTGGGGPSIGNYSGARGGEGHPLTQQDYDALTRQLQQLQQMSRDNRELSTNLSSLAHDLASLDPRRATANPRLVQQIEAQLLAKTEEVELMLRRKVDEKQGATVRSSAPAPVPQGYGDAVAEYYRRLSRAK